MKPYRIKHIPTGLYYKPGEVNLTPNGKVYTTNANALNYFTRGYIPINARAGSRLHISTKNVIKWEQTEYHPSKVSAHIPIEQFLKEEI